MARTTSYDDWNFMGDIQREDRRVRTRSSRPQQANLQRNSFIFLCVVCLLTLMGLVCVYSASFQIAVTSGFDHYHYLVQQAIYTAVGAVLFVGVNLMPERFLRFLSPVMFFVCLALLVMDTFFGKSILMTGDTIGFLFLSGVMYMSLFFSGRGNDIQRARDVIIPVIACIMVLLLILLQKNFTFAIMYLGIAVTMFASGGVGFVGIVLLLLYAAVPVVCTVLSKSERIIAVARFFIPGLGTSSRAAEISTVKSAIASGSWFGKGLGGGVFKNGTISDLTGKNILACICEELGLWGIVMIALFFAFFAFMGYKAARSMRRQNGFYSNVSVGITTIVVWQFILNIAWVLGIIPSGDGVPMPFFSFGIGIIPVLLESGLLYKVMRSKASAEENARSVSTMQDELMFPERYDFESN